MEETCKNKVNYQKELEAVLRKLEAGGEKPRLLLHACCAPCSSYVLEYLMSRFRITLLSYNPNISPEGEFRFRTAELERLARELPPTVPGAEPPEVIVGRYDPERFYEAVRGHESDKEGGARCEICFRMRLEETARLAKAGNYDYFTTTLSLSPLKNAQLLNQIGAELSETYGVPYLFSDFKKKNGYRRSVELSKTFGLYRQDYCGCVFSRKERECRTAER